jgi:hypothetical protein
MKESVEAKIATGHQRSIVAFLDILGFKELIKSRKDVESNLLDILYEIREEDSSFEEKIDQHEQRVRPKFHV